MYMDFYEDEYIDYGFLRYSVKESYWYLNLSGKEFSYLLDLKFQLAYGDIRHCTFTERVALEESYMKLLLDKKRFALYKEHQQRWIEDHIEEEKIRDKKNSRNLAYLEASISYLEERYLPRLAEIDRISIKDLKGNAKRRLLYLQCRYAQVLKEITDESIAEHLECYETYRPLCLQEYSLLKRQLEIVPNLDILMSGSRSRLKWRNIRRLLQRLDLRSSENYDRAVEVYQQMLYYQSHLWAKYPQSRELNPKGMLENVREEEACLYRDFSLLMMK